MPATEPRRSPEGIARLGTEVFDRSVRPTLRPEEDGKFIAIDIETGDRAAVSRLRNRRPSAVAGGAGGGAAALVGGGEGAVQALELVGGEAGQAVEGLWLGGQRSQ